MELECAAVPQWPIRLIHSVNSQLSFVGVLSASRPVLPSSLRNGNGNGNPRPAAVVVVVVVDAMSTEDSSDGDARNTRQETPVCLSQPGHRAAARSAYVNTSLRRRPARP